MSREKYRISFSLNLNTILKSKKLIYGNIPMMAFEIVEFLNDLGSIPVFIEERELCE